MTNSYSDSAAAGAEGVEEGLLPSAHRVVQPPVSASDRASAHTVHQDDHVSSSCTIEGTTTTTTCSSTTSSSGEGTKT
jgi:hypothetical protein